MLSSEKNVEFSIIESCYLNMENFRTEPITYVFELYNLLTIFLHAWIKDTLLYI